MVLFPSFTELLKEEICCKLDIVNKNEMYFLLLFIKPLEESCGTAGAVVPVLWRSMATKSNDDVV